MANVAAPLLVARAAHVPENAPLDSARIPAALVNEYGGYDGFMQSYDLSWGRVKSMTRPSVGDEEYKTGGGAGCDTTGTAKGYFDYFARRRAPREPTTNAAAAVTASSDPTTIVTPL